MEISVDISMYIHFMDSRRHGNKSVDEMGQKTVDEMGLDELGCYRERVSLNRVW